MNKLCIPAIRKFQQENASNILRTPFMPEVGKRFRNVFFSRILKVTQCKDFHRLFEKAQNWILNARRLH